MICVETPLFMRAAGHSVTTCLSQSTRVPFPFNVLVHWFRYFDCPMNVFVCELQLAYCVVQFLEKDSTLTEPVCLIKTC